MKIKVYLDTCIVSEVYNKRIGDDDYKALNDLTEMETIEFVVSGVMKEEFLKCPDENKRNDLSILYKIFNKCTLYNTVQAGLSGACGRTPAGRPPMHEDRLFKKIKTVFTQKDKDPEHIFQAVKNDCDYFLTVDYKSIIKKARNNKDILRAICPNLNFVGPTELLETLGEI